jgi:hypothetical protein
MARAFFHHAWKTSSSSVSAVDNASHYASTTSLVRLSSALQLSGQPIDETLCDLKPSRKMATRASLAISEAHTC